METESKVKTERSNSKSEKMKKVKIYFRTDKDRRLTRESQLTLTLKCATLTLERVTLTSSMLPNQ